ncbi:hypothetical protein DTL42_05345 [Bremerella cremea]|uniref:Alpha/beta hydrolase n=1 Tax=Bremerella cremea TaxID=1031537 RepID=A0A368KY96_9BACT|nr:hypothetical protein [Bremerella cremea]RCS54564.1 hypothetical protein DTL42_05345 [Bremerella cremea]
MNTTSFPRLPFRTCLFALLLLVVTTANVLADSSGYRESVDGYPCGYHCHTPRPGDEVYMISTRCLPGGCGWELPFEKVQIWHFVVGEGWVSIDWKELTEAESPGGLTSVYVHGNWMNSYWAQRRGWEMYHELTRDLPMDQKVRHVIWSWPTQEEKPALRSVRQNTVRADDDAYYLASYLRTLPTTEKVSLSAFSLGARVVTGACHLLGGGALHGRVLDKSEPNQHGYRVALFSAGVSSCAIWPGGHHGQALNVVDRLYNAFNSCDRVLKHYKLASRRRGDQAAGYIGFALTSEQRKKVEQVNAANVLGKEHSWDNVVCAYCVMERARDYLQWKEL